MKIALIGYGRMGHAIEEAAERRGHEIVARIDVDNQEDFDSEAFASADVAIEFTIASQAPGNIRRAWSKGLPVVSGTTGWLVEPVVDELRKEAEASGRSLIHSSNFSVGVNLLFAVNRYLARIIEPFGYSLAMEETHHIHKLDHPSGTAISLANGIIDSNSRYESWEETDTDAGSPGPVIPVECRREGENPGFHQVKWQSSVDSLTLSHQAFSRMGFAEGSVLAAEWIVRQPSGRVYAIGDMVNF